MRRGWLGVGATAVLVTLGCGGPSPRGADGGRDAPSNNQSDTTEAALDTASATPIDGDSGTASIDSDARADKATPSDTSPVADAGSETSAADPGSHDASGERSTSVDVGPDSSDIQLPDAASDTFSDSDASGACASDPNGTRFVDHALGTDDHAHGNGPGPCAFRTLTYAIGQASAQISLSAQDTYQGGVAGETLPFLLTGNQSLLCNGATLTYDMGQSTYDGIVDFAGTRNGMTGCLVDGQGLGGYCLVVNATAADVTHPHFITGSTVTGCGNIGIIVPNSFNGLIIANNTFTLNAVTVVLKGAHTNVSIVDNTFVANRDDIVCQDIAPGVSGSGNVGDGVDITCFNCGGCPFGP